MMDCKTARYLLSFHRSRTAELDHADQSALADHLAVCPECDTLARHTQALDEHLGQAIREVPIPRGLRKRLLERLSRERETWYRRRLARTTRVLAAVAAVFLLAYLGITGWKKHHLPRPNGDDLVNVALARHQYSPPDQKEAEDWFRRQGTRIIAPPQLDYRYLFSYHFDEFLGQKAPCLVFVRAEGARPAQIAQVYVLTSEHFDLSAVPAKLDQGSGDKFKVEIWRENRSFAYVIVYSGSLDDLLVPASERVPD